ncbi:MAG: hypothetical protein HY840_01465 [Bacteroidetes bacterium]|nr:hypothetical protein [Bacteroidota bacterium]
MNNSNANQKVTDCLAELSQLQQMTSVLGPFSNIVPYLTKYSVIKSCGTFESCFKTILADYASINQTQQLKSFIDSTLRNNSMNPSFSNIHQILKRFDMNWNKQFKQILKNHSDIKRIKTSIQSLNAARNNFAHGGNPTVSLSDVQNYFNDAIIIINILDNIVV